MFSLVIVVCIMPFTSRLSLAPHARKLVSAGRILPMLFSYKDGGIIVNSLPVSVNSFTLLSPILTFTIFVLFLLLDTLWIGDIFFRRWVYWDFAPGYIGWVTRFIDVSVVFLESGSLSGDVSVSTYLIWLRLQAFEFEKWFLSPHVKHSFPLAGHLYCACSDEQLRQLLFWLVDDRLRLL